jgi:hypothetical protein
LTAPRHGAIAGRIQAHQPQINYRFELKAALWTAAVDCVFGLPGKANAADVQLPELPAPFA